MKIRLPLVLLAAMPHLLRRRQLFSSSGSAMDPRMELPNGAVEANAFLEASGVLALVINRRLFLRRETGVTEVVLEEGFAFLELAAARGGELVALLDGPLRTRPKEPLISDRRYLRVIDPRSGTQRPLTASPDFAIMHLIGTAQREDEVLCICSDSRRTPTMVYVDYHVAALSLVTGAFRVLARNIGPNRDAAKVLYWERE